MIELTKVMSDPKGHVHKLIFEDDKAIAEVVAYKYADRRVVCLSVQSGCRIGCKFCGTGQRFIRNFTTEEMILQMNEGLAVVGKARKIQIMTMSMGEPMDNWQATRKFSEYVLNEKTNWNVFISSVGLRDSQKLKELLDLGQSYNYFGLQFSLHHWDHRSRFELLGRYPDLMSIRELSAFGKLWTARCGKLCYFNYICTGDETQQDAEHIADLVDGMHLTCSVKCDTGDFTKASSDPATRFANMVMCSSNSIEVSTFDPAGQDTIGGGCGQLLYVQERLKDAQRP